MRYDLTRCNNLRWKCGERTGFIKTDGHLVRVLADEMWLSRHGEMQHYCVADFTAERAEEWLSNRSEFEIVPRDPETYKDWQVGDVVADEDGYYLTVEARLGNIVFLVCQEGDIYSASDAYYTCDEMYRNGYRLVLTDYEKEIAEAKETHGFSIKSGDKVVWRDHNTHTWDIGIFLRCNNYETDMPTQYEVRQLQTSLGISFMCDECLPYNEKTWKLLGTTDDYKEE